MNDTYLNDMHRIVMRLIGPVQPVGSHGVDEKRCENMKLLIELIDDLLGEVYEASECTKRHEASMAKIGKQAQEALRIWNEDIYELI